MNYDHKKNIHFGVIPRHEINAYFEYDSAEVVYQKCEIHSEDDFCDCELIAIGEITDNKDYFISCNFDDPSLDLFIERSPYFTYSDLCSPCAPNAGYLLSESNKNDGYKTYCLGPEYFKNGIAPYKIYSVETGELIA